MSRHQRQRQSRKTKNSKATSATIHRAKGRR
jgi:hypothetical protein